MQAGELTDVLELSRWLATQVSSEEHATIMRHAREGRPPGLSYVEHLAAICKAISNGGKQAASQIAAFAALPLEERQQRIEIEAWLRDRMARVRKTGRVLERGDQVDVAGMLSEKLHEMWPTAHDAKIAGAIGLGTSARGLDLGMVVRCMREPDVLERV